MQFNPTQPNPTYRVRVVVRQLLLHHSEFGLVFGGQLLHERIALARAQNVLEFGRLNLVVVVHCTAQHITQVNDQWVER